MIYHKLQDNDVSELLAPLKSSLPGSAKLYYLVMQYLRGECPGVELIADTWPNWQCVIAKPSADQEATIPNYLKHNYLCHTKSRKSLKYFIQRPGVINWSQPVMLSGLPMELMSTFQELARKEGGTVTQETKCFMYSWPSAAPPHLDNLPLGMHLTRLDPEQAQRLTVDTLLSSGDDDDPNASQLMSSLLNNFESSCLITDDGQVVAYAWIQYYSFMGGIFVKPRHRQKGHDATVMRDLTRKVHAKGHVPFVYTVTNDTATIQMMQKLGFRWEPSGDTTWAQYTPRTSVESASSRTT